MKNVREISKLSTSTPCEGSIPPGQGISLKFWKNSLTCEERIALFNTTFADGWVCLRDDLLKNLQEEKSSTYARIQGDLFEVVTVSDLGSLRLDLFAQKQTVPLSTVLKRTQAYKAPRHTRLPILVALRNLCLYCDGSEYTLHKSGRKPHKMLEGFEEEAKSTYEVFMLSKFGIKVKSAGNCT